MGPEIPIFEALRTVASIITALSSIIDLSDDEADDDEDDDELEPGIVVIDWGDCSDFPEPRW